MPRVRRPATPTSPATLLQLMWLASPALPVGGFCYSEGLESAVESGRVTSEALATTWLLDQLHLSLARCDLPALAQAMQAWRRSDARTVQTLNDWILQTRESAELRQQTEQMGRSMGEWLRNGGSDLPATDASMAPSLRAKGAVTTTPGARPDSLTMTRDPRIAQLTALTPAPTWPIAFALAAARTPAVPRDALLAFAFGWAENMVQAAMKAVPLGQNAAQRILAHLSQAVPEAVASALSLPPQTRQAHTPMLAILSAQHETQYSRLFRS